PLEASKSQSETLLISDLGACFGSPAWLAGGAGRTSGGGGGGRTDDAGAEPLRVSAVAVPTRPCWSSTQSKVAALPASETSSSDVLPPPSRSSPWPLRSASIRCSAAAPESVARAPFSLPA